MFVDKLGHGKGGGLENKNKRASRKIRISAGRLRMHEIDLEFLLKNGLPPPNGGMTCYNLLYAMLYLLLYYAILAAMLVL